MRPLSRTGQGPLSFQKEFVTVKNIKTSTPAIDGEKYLRDFFDHAPIGFHVFGPDRKIIDINQAELDMIGYAHEEVVGKKTWGDLIIPEEKPLFEQHWKNLCRQGKALNLYYTLIHKDGHRLRVLLNATAHLDDSGNLLNTRGSVVDITEKEQTEEAVRASALELGKQKQALEQKNLALREILAHIEIEKNQIKEDVIANVEKLVLPTLNKLRRKGTVLDRKNIDLLEHNLKQLTVGFGRAVGEQRWKLSPREIEICGMIKNGLTTKEMTGLLNTSRRTIENHRNRIRKKLEISQKNINLTAYLQSFK